MITLLYAEGAYNYLYGATSVKLRDFILGLSAASVKPYLLDAYLGVYGKSVLDNDGDGSSDWVVCAVVAVLLLVGELAAN